MRFWERLTKLLVLFGTFALAAYFAITFRAGGLWRGLEPALAVTVSPGQKGPYDLTRLEAVNETLKTIRDKYVDPSRVHPREMFLSALNYVQRDVAQVIVLYEEGGGEVTVRVESAEKKFRVDNVQGPWDVSARLREVFAFVQDKLRGTEVDLREVEYAACNGMLHTLDPHSVFLSPDAYKEMNLNTSGAFGGLGIVISIRDQMLTVMNPMPGTPAGKAGLLRFDRITKINNESTLNMPLDDAVKRLRGDPGTKVTVWVHRDGRDNVQGWKDSKPFELVRERIQVKSVESRLLEGDVGYIRLKQFQSGSSGEVDNALAEFRQKAGTLRGVVLDLRGNPGGLLDQAAKIADKWIKDGVLVATVGMAEGREEKLAHPEGNEPEYPLVVLVSGSSASASEIVAGALKNHDRAVLVGEQTFGKGSVQLVFPDVTPDKAALKLTIAQYLTPGDVSIQGVGVTPDIELDPMTVDPLEMDIYVQRKGLRERDLSQHLSNSHARDSKPLELVRYNLSQADRQAMRERGGDPEDTFTPDFPIRFARELVTHLPAGKRPDAVHAAKDYIAQVSREEWNKVSADMQKLSVDWTDTTTTDLGPTPKELDVKVETDREGADVVAGEPMTLKVTVKNNGKAPAFRLRATTKSDNSFLDNKELIFGKINPGQAKTATVPLGWCEVEGRKPGTSTPVATNAQRVCKIPKDSVTRSDGIKVKFDATGGHAPSDAEIRTTIHGLDRPVFSYAYQIADNRGGNGDGRVQRGEAVTMYLTIKNVGRGRSYETQANIRNLSGDGLLLRDGRFDVPSMAPGEVRKVTFTFDVGQQLPDNEAKVELSVGDRDLREVASEKIKIPIEPAAQLTPMPGPVTAGPQGALLFDEPQANGRPFGKLAQGASLARLAKVGDYAKVDLGNGRFAFVPAKDIVEGGKPASPPAFDDLYSHAPPTIDLAPSALATRDGHIKLGAAASDGTRLLDAYVFVGSRKVFYKSNGTSTDPKKMNLEADVALRPGVNVITVFARESPDTMSRRTIVVRRDGPNGELLPTPTTEDSLWETKEDDELP
ncbi:MAG TPA: MXAN_5808 family serine peptidase [Polyangiaceae bacterium]|nr:MXAN_5808 family serine peptidase [Polyangiaceae bacterium]